MSELLYTATVKGQMVWLRDENGTHPIGFVRQKGFYWLAIPPAQEEPIGSFTAMSVAAAELQKHAQAGQ